MASEIRVNKIENRSGLGTVTFADTGVDLAGIVTATTFSGSGASLTGLPAAQLSGTLPAISGANLTNLAAANLTGTIADARFPATLPAASAANLTSIPAANVTGTLPALTAANLTNIPAANIVGVCTAGLTKTGGFGNILQVVHVENTAYGAQDSVANTKYDGLSFGVQITPTSSSSTIMLWYSITLSAEVAEREISLTPTVNDGSSVSEFAQGVSSGSKTRINASDIATERNSSSVTINFHCHHSPSTTSQRTYGFYHTVQHDGGWIVRNQSFTSPDNANSTRSTSTITAMEVAG